MLRKLPGAYVNHARIKAGVGPRHCTAVGRPLHLSSVTLYDSLVLTMHKTLVIDWLTYVQNI